MLDEAIVRNMNALSYKTAKKYNEYLQAGCIQNDVPFLIALGSYDQINYGREFIYAMMALLYGWYYDTSNDSYIPKNSIAKENGAELDIGLFNKTEYENISGVLFSCTTTIGKLTSMALSNGKLTLNKVYNIRRDHEDENIPYKIQNEKLDTYFITYYAKKEFDNMCKHIGKILSNPAHKQCFNECVAAYNSGMFTICLTNLTTILEGVLSLFGDNPSDIRMMKICQYHVDESNKKNQRIKCLSWLSMNEFIRAFFEKRDFALTEPDNRNRHRLLHGRTSKIGEQADCIRLFNAVQLNIMAKGFALTAACN